MATLREYQLFAKTTAVYPKEIGLLYCGLGLANEAGEVAGKIKKLYRDHGGVLDDSIRKAILDELGDVLWYMAQLCTEMNVTFDWVMGRNVEKLENRVHDNTIKGDGDDR